MNLIWLKEPQPMQTLKNHLKRSRSDAENAETGYYAGAQRPCGAGSQHVAGEDWFHHLSGLNLTHKKKYDIIQDMTPKQLLEGIDFGDKRLNRRLGSFIEQKTKNVQESSIIGAVKERSQAKAFYRLLGNDKFDLGKMQEQVKTATISQMEADSTVLLIQDTMDTNLNGHKKTEGLGYSSEQVLGVKEHNCIAVTTDGLPLGLLTQSYETREEAKSTLTAKEKGLFTL